MQITTERFIKILEDFLGKIHETFVGFVFRTKFFLDFIGCIKVSIYLVIISFFSILVKKKLFGSITSKNGRINFR